MRKIGQTHDQPKLTYPTRYNPDIQSVPMFLPKWYKYQYFVKWNDKNWDTDSNGLIKKRGKFKKNANIGIRQNRSPN